MGTGTLSRPGLDRPGIVAALPGEARPLVRLRAQGMARLPGGARIALSGLGAQRAGATARRLVADGADALVSWGCAAALAPALTSGDLILPHEIIARDDTRYAVDADWLERMTAQLDTTVRVRHDALVEAPDLLVDVAAKRTLHELTGAVAADMESAAVAAIAAEFDLPFIAVRVIADDAHMTLPPAARMAIDANGALRPGHMMRALAGRPRSMHAQLRALKQLAVAFRAARNTLARVAPCVTGEAGP